MIDETSLEEEMRWSYEQLAKIAIDRMNRHNIHAQYVPTRQEALTKRREQV